MLIPVAGTQVYAYTGSRSLDRSRSAIVFVHGAGNDHSVWTLQSRYFAHHGRNVLAVDLPGHGRSGGALLKSVEELADWIAQLIDAAGVSEAAVVGHSLGALVALEAAARHPKRIERVALLGPSAPMPVADVLLDAARAGDHVACELIVGWSHSPAKQLGGNPVPGLWMSGGTLRLLERSRPGTLYTDLVACHVYQNGLAAAAALHCRALVVTGTRDLMAPARNAQALIDTLPDRRVVTLPECGHAMMSEQPDAVLDALRAFH